jgi:hypothetical protein
MEPTRYRAENGVPCIDVKVSRIEQLFDNRDPAPFRERDLDPDLAEYLLDAGEDLVGHARYSVVFWLEHAAAKIEIEQAFRGHFEELLTRLRRRRRRGRRTGQVTLLLGLVLVVILFTLAQLVGRSVPGSLGAGLREGLVISSWVVLWRPVEVLVYEWIPARHDRRVVSRLLASTIEVRTGRPE